MRRLYIVAALLLLLAAPAAAQKATVTRSDGGPMKIDVAGAAVLNKDSALHREWIVIHHTGIPVKLEYEIGVTAERVGRDYLYKSDIHVTPQEPIAALEIRFLLFDVWGSHIKTLSFTRVADLEPGGRQLGQAAWNLYSANEASEFYASIAYVARVRTKAGRIINSDIAPVLDEARKFSSKFSAEDLEPKRPAPRDI